MLVFSLKAAHNGTSSFDVPKRLRARLRTTYCCLLAINFGIVANGQMVYTCGLSKPMNSAFVVFRFHGFSLCERSTFYL